MDDASAKMAEHQRFYNFLRPHSSLRYLCPADYHYGDADALLRERAARMELAEADRLRFWHVVEFGRDASGLDSGSELVHLPRQLPYIHPVGRPFLVRLA